VRSRKVWGRKMKNLPGQDIHNVDYDYVHKSAELINNEMGEWPSQGHRDGSTGSTIQ